MQGKFKIVWLLNIFLYAKIAGNAQIAISQTKSEYPIVAWYSIEPGKNNIAEYKKLSKAGFNFSLSYFNSYDELFSSLQDAESSGIKLIAHCPEISNASERVLEQIRHSRALGLYYLKDEPSALDFSQISETSKRIFRVDSTHQHYVNLLPIYASKELLKADSYIDYLNLFYDIVHPSFLSFDHYPFVDEGMRDDFYSNLEVVSSFCEEKSIPFWGFARTALSGRYNVIDEARLRLQVFANIAYGAQGIQYFTYTVPKGCESAILDTNYTPTTIYNIVADVNKEVKVLSKFLLGGKVVKVWHSEDVKQNGIDSENHSLDIDYDSNGDFLLSIISNESKIYLIVVNKDYKRAQRFNARFSSKVRIISKTGRIKRKKTINSEVAAGDFLLFKIK